MKTSFIESTILISICILMASLNFSFGFSQDMDGYLIMQYANYFGESGSIIQSRTWGFPLYENIIYRIIAWKGVSLAKGISMLFYIGAVLILRQILILIDSSNRMSSFFLAVGFAVSPFMIISGNSLMETSLGVFLSLMAIYFFILSRNKTVFFWGSILFLSMATATRPDYVILSFSIFVGKIFLERRLSWITILQGIVYWIITIIPFLFYTNFTMPLNLINQSPIFIKIIKIVLVFLSLFGLPFYLVLMSHGIGIFKKVLSNPNIGILIIYGVSLVLYTCRLWMIPDEVEYILILLPLTLILIYSSKPSAFLNILISVSIILPNFAQIHFFSRDFFGDLHTEIGISKGAILQDRSFRIQNEYSQNKKKNDLEKIANEIGIHDYIFFPSMVPNINIITSSQNLRQYEKGREDPRYYKAFPSQTIYVYPFPEHKGWKQFIKFEEFQEVTEVFKVRGREPYTLEKVN